LFLARKRQHHFLALASLTSPDDPPGITSALDDDLGGRRTVDGQRSSSAYSSPLANKTRCTRSIHSFLPPALINPHFLTRSFNPILCFPAKRALRPGMISASPASTDASQCIASRHDLCRPCVRRCFSAHCDFCYGLSRFLRP